jgi:DNA-binding NarL/FixJ family response regulator
MLRVLIVDDQPTFRHHLRQSLTYAGFDVIGEAGSIPIAEELLQTFDHQPDIAVIDVMLPGIGGLEGTSRLKALYPTLRVFLVSAYHDQAQVFQISAREVGAEAFIAKDDLDLDTIKKWKNKE